MKAALTDKPPAPVPEPKKKRREEDTRGLFKVARVILHTTHTMRRHFSAMRDRIFNTAANRRPALMQKFRSQAGQIVPRAPQLPAEAYATATAYLWDTLDWLNPWHHHDAGSDMEHHDHAPANHLTLHL